MRHHTRQSASVSVTLDMPEKWCLDAPFTD
jgi:hypothetical protein